MVQVADLGVHEWVQGDQDQHEAEEGGGRQHVQGTGPDLPSQQSLFHTVQQPHGCTWHLSGHMVRSYGWVTWTGHMATLSQKQQHKQGMIYVTIP